jgi:hypothetical protein
VKVKLQAYPFQNYGLLDSAVDTVSVTHRPLIHKAIALGQSRAKPAKHTVSSTARCCTVRMPSG